MLSSGLFGYMSDYLIWCGLLASLFLHTWCFFRFFSGDKRPRTRLVVGNALIFLCMICSVAWVAETYLRFISIKTDAFGMTLPAQRWFVLYTDLNSLDCRDEEWSTQKLGGVRRIAFVGDSFTYGWGIEEPKNRFTDQLQARFDKKSPGKVEVMNVAKPGWATEDQLQPIRDMITHYGVDEVVLCHTPNDIEKILPRSAEFDPTKPPQAWLINTDSSCLLDYLYRRVYSPYVSTVRNYHDWLADGYSNEQTWRKQQEVLGSVIKSCRQENVKLRVVLLPFIMTCGENYDGAKIHENIAGFFKLNDVEVIDLLPAISTLDPTDLIVNCSDPHPNEKANEIFTQVIWERFYADRSASPKPSSPSPPKRLHPNRP